MVPVVYIVANFTRPNGTIPALLDLDETTTFFHEFGHALHLLFSDVPYRGLLAVENDFVELPSQIMENWATEPEMLRSYAIHWQTGKVIPENLIKRIQESALFNQGSRRWNSRRPPIPIWSCTTWRSMSPLTWMHLRSAF